MIKIIPGAYQFQSSLNFLIHNWIPININFSAYHSWRMHWDSIQYLLKSFSLFYIQSASVIVMAQIL